VNEYLTKTMAKKRRNKFFRFRVRYGMACKIMVGLLGPGI
jgi:hypothetical protein